MKLQIHLALLLVCVPLSAHAAFSVKGERNHEGYAQTIDYQAAKKGTLIINETEEALEDALAKILDHRDFLVLGVHNAKLKMSGMRNRTTNSTASVTTHRQVNDQTVPYFAYGYQWVDFSGRISYYSFSKLEYQADPVLDSGGAFRYTADVSQSAVMMEGQYNLYEIDWFDRWVNNFWPHIGAGVGFVWKTVKAKAQAGATGNRSVDELDLAWNWHAGIQGQITADFTVDAGYQSFDLSRTKLPRVEETSRVRLTADKMVAKGPFIQLRYWF